MRSPRLVDDFPPNDHYTNLTLAHSNLSLNVKHTLVLKSGEKKKSVCNPKK